MTNKDLPIFEDILTHSSSNICQLNACPERLQRLELPSPNSCLPQDTLEEVEQRIRAANQFLLNTALSSDFEENEVIHMPWKVWLDKTYKLPFAIAMNE
ncbi:hypothetical protein J416_07017 [Gracilibacillus halophilus YIM-C55.5]|uniref:Uncharacterized protein n=1 Tax=Gracilibacillus halophilus YIM-C55.5 TaxID=1308866 RepID=N4WS11_9BACI|nr:hypothetical protein [Gracilibacillus halophilus]ENH97175.1 hypothetical protein J416_07017 [Gracilibacillus halophilus YIM-C55.5]